MSRKFYILFIDKRNTVEYNGLVLRESLASAREQPEGQIHTERSCTMDAVLAWLTTQWDAIVAFFLGIWDTIQGFFA